MIVTTTDTIEGYYIKKYLGTVTGAHYFLIGGIIGEGFSARNMSVNASNTYNTCVKQMILNAPSGTNAIIGVKSNMAVAIEGSIVCSLVGTAVIVEEIVSDKPITVEDKKREEEQKLNEEKTQERRKELEKRFTEKKERFASNVLENGFDMQGFLDSISSYDFAREVLEDVSMVNEMHPDIFDEEILNDINKSVKLERMYGTKEAKNCLKKIRTYFGMPE